MDISTTNSILVAALLAIAIMSAAIAFALWLSRKRRTIVRPPPSVPLSPPTRTTPARFKVISRTGSAQRFTVIENAESAQQTSTAPNQTISNTINSPGFQITRRAVLESPPNSTPISLGELLPRPTYIVKKHDQRYCPITNESIDFGYRSMGLAKCNNCGTLLRGEAYLAMLEGGGTPKCPLCGRNQLQHLPFS